MKNLPQEVLDVIESGYIRIVHGVHVGLDTPIAFVDGGHFLSHGGIDYQASSTFQGLEKLSTYAEMRVGEINLGFSMTDQATTALLLGTEPYNRKVTINRFFLDDDGEVFHVEHVWRGRITGLTSDDEEAVISLTVASRWAAFEAANTWRTTDLSHKRRFPKDGAMKYSSSASETIYWAGEAGAK